MDEAILSDEFDDALSEIACATADKTVHAVNRELWFHYDDLEDHLIVATKDEWAYFNRLLLLLASDAEIEVVRDWGRWRVNQLIAAVTLTVSLYIVIRQGLDSTTFWIVVVSCGLVFMALQWFDRSRYRAQKRKAALEPFPSVGTLLLLRRSLKDFVRKRYPKALAGRRIRGPEASTLMWIGSVPLWLILSPLLLMIRMLPERRTRFAMPQARS